MNDWEAENVSLVVGLLENMLRIADNYLKKRKFDLSQNFIPLNFRTNYHGEFIFFEIPST